MPTHHQLTKLILTPQKPSSSLEIFVAAEELVEKSNLGQLFIIIEIKSREKGIREKIKQIIELIKNDYYSSPTLDIESSLESTCQNLNLNLPEIIVKPEMWYKKIHLLVGVTRDNVLTFSSWGDFSGYLIRHKKISQILNSLSQSQPVTNNLLSQLTSGEVKPGDIIIISTYSLFDFFSLEKIRTTLLKLSPGQAAEQFKNLINQAIKIPHILSIIIKYEKESELNDKNQKTKKYLEDLYGSQESMQQLESLEQRTTRTLTSSLWPTLNKIKFFFSFQKKKADKKATDKKDLKLPREKRLNLSLFKNIKLPSLFGLKKVKPEVKIDSHVKIKKLYLKNFNLLWIIIILIIIFISSLAYLRYNKNIKEKNGLKQNILFQVEDKKSQAEAALIYQDREKASNLLINALELLQTLPLDNNEKWQSEFENKKQEITKLVNKVNNIFEIELETVVDLSNINLDKIKDIIQLQLDKNQLYVLTGISTIYQILPSEKSFSLFLSQDNLKSITVWDEKNLILINQDNQFYLKNIENKEQKILNITLPTDIQISDLKVYGERIYVLDSNAAKIYKISQPLSKSPKIEEWYEDDKDFIKDSKQIIIDGYVWTTNQNEIVKLFKGRKENFSLSRLNTKLGNDLKIYTQLDWSFIYILDKDNGRLLVINKDGLVEKQLINQLFKNSDFLIVDKGQSIAWIEVENKIYQAWLKGE